MKQQINTVHYEGIQYMTRFAIRGSELESSYKAKTVTIHKAMLGLITIKLKFKSIAFTSAKL